MPTDLSKACQFSCVFVRKDRCHKSLLSRASHCRQGQTSITFSPKEVGQMVSGPCQQTTKVITARPKQLSAFCFPNFLARLQQRYYFSVNLLAQNRYGFCIR
jgi:hypothetical protein